jgi:hypothetical protein
LEANKNDLPGFGGGSEKTAENTGLRDQVNSGKIGNISIFGQLW